MRRDVNELKQQQADLSAPAFMSRPIRLLQRIGPETTVFVLVAFEGPDAYSLAGGLGSRVTHLSGELAKLGFETHLVFVGDPTAPWSESYVGGKLTLYRWCQWISRRYPSGVYQGEEEKVADFSRSVPQFVVEQIAGPALSNGKMVVIMGEEWHTAATMGNISNGLAQAGLRDRAILLWNANNTFGFDRIDWRQLSSVAVLTTVSKYMKLLMKAKGLDPLVIPNGVPKTPHTIADPIGAEAFKDTLLGEGLLFFKMARWDPAKGWPQALEAVARLKAMGQRVRLVVRGGVESYGGQVLAKAQSLGMTVRQVVCDKGTLAHEIRAIAECRNADVLDLHFFVRAELSRLLYAAADGVLANSLHEPFGLVGLEAMAAGGIAYTGSTGEDYSRHMENSVVLQTEDPQEIVAYSTYLMEHPALRRSIQREAQRTAASYAWDNVIRRDLLPKLEMMCWRTGTSAHARVALDDQGRGSRSER